MRNAFWPGANPHHTKKSFCFRFELGQDFNGPVFAQSVIVQLFDHFTNPFVGLLNHVVHELGYLFLRSSIMNRERYVVLPFVGLHDISDLHIYFGRCSFCFPLSHHGELIWREWVLLPFSQFLHFLGKKMMHNVEAIFRAFGENMFSQG